MSGLLGALGGAAKGVADRRLADIDEREKFDYAVALDDIRLMKEMALKERGIQLEDQRDKQKRSEAAARMKEAYGPEDTRGGWQSDEAKAAEAATRDEAAARKLESMGYADEADPIYKRLDRNRKAELDAERVNNAFTQGQEKLKLQGEANAAKAEAAAARAAKAPEPSEREKLYSAYTKRVKSEGGKPMSYDKWDIWMKQNIEKPATTEEVDSRGRVTKSTTKRPAKPAQSSSGGDIKPAGVVLKFDSQGNLIK